MACRPISKTKRFRLVSIDKHAAALQGASEAEAALENKEGSAAVVAPEEKPVEAKPEEKK